MGNGAAFAAPFPMLICSQERPWYSLRMISSITFYKITMAVVRAVKQRHAPSPLLAAIRSIGYAEVAASVLTMQRSMLVSFEGMAEEKIHLMNSLTGAVVCLFVLVLGIAMIIKSTKRKEPSEWQNQNL